MLSSHMQNIVRPTHDTKPKDETDGKEHSQSPNEQQVVESNQNNRPANLSAHVNKTCIELALGTLPIYWFQVSHDVLSLQ